MTIAITTETVIKTMAILMVILFLYLIRNIVMATLFSIVIASGIDPMVSWLQKRRIPRALAVTLIYLVALAFLGGIFYLVIPTAFSELSAFADRLPAYLEKPFKAGAVDKIFGNLPVFARDALGGSFIKISDYLNDFSSGFLQMASSAAGGVISFILIIVLSFYLSIQERGIENFLKTVTPRKYENYSIGLWIRWKNKISLWSQGQVLLGLSVGVMVYIGLVALGVEYAFTFALMAAVFEIIPIFGPVLSAILPVIVSLLKSPFLGLEVFILYVLIQQFENHLIYPLVIRKIVGVPSVMVILAFVIGAQVGGFFGILLSIPLAVLATEVLSDLDLRKKQNKES